MISNATLFSANENFRRLLQWGDPQKTLSIAEMTVAGGLSGIVIALVICPIELVKVRLQVQTGAALEGGRVSDASTGGGGLQKILGIRIKGFSCQGGGIIIPK